MRLPAWCLFLLMCGAASAGAGALAQSATPLVEEGGFRLAQGFTCKLYAGDELAHDISCMTFDATGRVVVSGPGYIRTLLPDASAPANAPKPQRAVVFSDLPKSGAQGLCFVGGDLYASGDNAVWKFKDADGDGVADGPPEQFVSGLKTGGEHGVHGIVQGPDGWLYIIGGNDSGISERLNTLPSPQVRQVTGGAILRVSLDGKQREVIAHGFRNPYGMCFNDAGSLFTWDSDGERVQHLPFYAPCRVFDVGRGRHHGWVNAGWQNSWSRPPWWPDVVDRMIEVGRGSPTGIVCYRHRQFPEAWRNGLFFACWTFGRVYFAKPQHAGATYTAKHEVFLESTGNAGFSPTALAIGPDGALYVSTGGRKTKGGVYRVAPKEHQPLRIASHDGEKLFEADQPDAAWSRAIWLPLARKYGEKACRQFLLDSAKDGNRNFVLRAISILREVFRGVDDKTAYVVAKRMKDDPDVRRRLVDALLPEEYADYKSPAFLMDSPENARADEPRAVGEALHWRGLGGVGISMTEEMLLTVDCWESWRSLPVEARDIPMLAIRVAMHHFGDVRTSGKASWSDGYEASEPPIRVFLQDLSGPRFMRHLDGIHALMQRVPHTREEDYEYARLVAMTDAEPPGFWETLPLKWTADSSVEDDLHYLFVAARRTKPHAAADLPLIARAWLGLSHKMLARQQYPSRFWAEMVGAAFAEMLRKNPSLAEVMVAQETFSLAEHTVFVQAMPKDDRVQAIVKLTGRAKAWSPQLVKLAGEILGERTPHLSGTGDPAALNADQWQRVQANPDRTGGDLIESMLSRISDASLRDAIILTLPEFSYSGRAELALPGLDSLQPSVVEKSLQAVKNNHFSAEEAEDASRPVQHAKGPKEQFGNECIKLLLAVRRLEGQPGREKLVQRLRDTCAEFLIASGQESRPTEPNAAELENAMRKRFPEESTALISSPILNLDQELARWAKLDVSKGDASRGKVIFEQRQCVLCHAGGSRLGPDLKGITTRWSVPDLFLHTADPSRQISPTWEGETFTLKDGRQFTGRPAYDSPEAILVQTTPDETVRITGPELQSRRKAEISLMPPGLLAGLTDAELADLHAYLRELK